MARFREDEPNETFDKKDSSEYKPRRMRDDSAAPAAADAVSGEVKEEAPSPKKKKKKRKKSSIILWIILIAAILTLLISGGMVIWEMVLQPSMNDSLNDEIRSLAGISEVEDEPIDFDALRAINPDIVGWIRIPNTLINHPVLQASIDNPEFYLYRDYKKNDTKYGSIFLDAGASIHRDDYKSKSLTLYGHHMNDGRMFADVMKYEDLDFYKRTPVFQFDTYEDRGSWKVIALVKTNVLKSQGEVFQYVRNGFLNDDDFLDFVHNIMIRSTIKTGVKVNEDDQLVVLSTCSYEYENFRTIVVARRVREGEDKSVDVSAASYNNAPLYPDIWYSNGGNKPTYPVTFKEAKAQGLTDWYDGDSRTGTTAAAADGSTFQSGTDQSYGEDDGTQSESSVFTAEDSE